MHIRTTRTGTIIDAKLRPTPGVIIRIGLQLSVWRSHAYLATRDLRRMRVLWGDPHGPSGR